jgi:hypothetical protein
MALAGTRIIHAVAALEIELKKWKIGEVHPYFSEFIFCQQRLHMSGAGMVLPFAHPLHLGATRTVQRSILWG